MIIMVIHSPPREAHYLDVPPLCLHIAYTSHCLIFTLHFKFSAPFPAGQAGEASRPKYADDTQLRVAMSSDDTSDGLSVLAACTAEVRQWYLQNGLQLNPDKSEALVIGTANQLRTANTTLVPPTQPSHRYASPTFSYRWPTRSKCSVSCWIAVWLSTNTFWR